jgi:multisubunit Na+/H+ antiporter MnhE subunit
VDRPQRRSARAFGGLVLAFVLAAFWVLFAGSVEPLELAMGAAVAELATLALVASELRSLAKVVFVGRLFAQARYLPIYAVTGTWDILRVLLSQLAGRGAAPSLLAALPYAAVGESEFDATRRALAITFTTISPNFVVIDIDRAGGLLLFHQLEDSETPKMTLALGADA